MSSTRDRIVRKTAELLTRQGYHATGLNQIVRESEAPRGSLYHYFPGGKEELAAEAVRFRGEQMRDHVAYELARYDDPHEAVQRLIETMIKNLLRRNFEAGAPMAAVSMEASSASEVLREACQAAYQTVQAPLREKFLAAGYPEAQASQAAVAIVAALEGGLVLSYAAHTPEPLEQVAAAVEGYLDGLHRQP